MGVGQRKLAPLWTLALALACTQHTGHAQDSSSESSYGHHPALSPIARGPSGVPLRGVTLFPPLRTIPVVRAFNPAHNGRVCSTWGNFHYKTFDGDVFRFPGLCNYVFSEHCGAAYEDFNVQLRRSQESAAPTLSRVLMKVDGVVIQLSKGSVLVNGRPVLLPFSQAGVFIQQGSSYTKVEARLGLVLMWNHDDSLLLELDAKYANKTCGLCGDFNGMPVVSELLSHNIKLTPMEFGNLQKMDDPTEQCEDPVPEPPRNCSTGFGICEELLNGQLFSSCVALVDVSSYLEACRQDLCFCGGTDLLSCVCHTLAEYSRQCAHAGGLPQDWRGPDLCPQTCPSNMQYHECRSPCTDTCSNQEHSRACEDHCVAGCFCPEGTVLDDVGQTGCVPASQCACVYNGAAYAPGATYSTDCTNCTCSGGRWSCQEVPCPGTCSVLGGAHFSTFDERHYTVHGDCSYVLTKPCDSSAFTVLAELRRCGLTDSETCLKSVTLSLDGAQTVVVIKASGEVFLNQIYTQLPISAANVTIFRPSTFFIIAQTSLGLQLDLQLVPTMQLFVRLAPKLRGQTCGLCGNFNSIQADDFRTLSGVVEATAAAFFNTFKTQAACPNIRNSFEDPCSLSVENEKYAQHWCSQLTNANGPFSRCHAAVKPDTYYSNCMFDTCNCERSEDCLCAVLSSYVHACAAKGVQLSGWRNGVCTKPMTTCPKSMTYHYHVSTCQPTCRSLSEGDITCRVGFIPVDGCTCPEGTFLDDTGKCVQASNCPCYHRDSVIPSGESVHDSGAVCTCTHGKLSCIGGQAPTPVCAAPMVFFDCRNATTGETGAGCQKSCHTLDMTCYSPQCVPGCVCPDGLVADGEGGCITVEDCPCVHNEASYRAGQTIRVGCNTCTCDSRMWRCTDNPCLATCAVYGDGHYLTFDGQSYSFNGDCEYMLVQNHCGGKGSAQDSFRVITENVPCGTTGTTCSKAIKIFLGGSELKLSHGKVEVIGTDESQEVPYTIRQMGIYLVVDTDIGLVLLWDKKTSIFINLSPEFKSRVCGLCGNFDDIAVNDFATRSQSVVGDALEFGNSWKLSPSCPDALAAKDPCTANPFRKSWAQKQCSLLHGPTFAACHAHVEPARYYEACVNDACACDSGGDCECFCTAVAAYAQACHEVGLCVSWRTPSICPLFCDYYNPEGQCEWHYQPCGAPCLRTCRNPRGDCLQDVRGLEGCYPKCPTEAPIFDEDKMQCVATCPTPPPPLPCHVHGKSYRPGAVVPSDKNCHSCLCTERGVECSYEAEACVCTYDGQHFHPGDVIYHTTDGTGGCISARCGANGTIERRVYPCSPTTPIPPTTFSFSTPPLVVSSTHTPSPVPSSAHTGPPSSAWRTTAGTSPRTRLPTASASLPPVCGEECLWSPWMDVSRPGRGMDSGDFDTLENLRAHGYLVCESPRSVECRAEDAPRVPLRALEQRVQCSLDMGLTCHNREQASGLCYNYQIRVMCCTPLSCSTSSSSTQTTPPTTSKTTETRASASSVSSSTPGPVSLSTSRTTPAPGTATSVKKTFSTPSPPPVPATSTSSMSTTAPGTSVVSSKPTHMESTTSSCVHELCTWTEWIDGSYPEPGINGGDFDTFQNLRDEGYKFCENPRSVECRAQDFPNTPLADLGQDVICSRTEGLICLNKNQLPPICYNYEIRIQCCKTVNKCRDGTRTLKTVTTTRPTPHPAGAQTQTTFITHMPSASTEQPTATSRGESTATSITQGTHNRSVTRDCHPQCTWTKWFDVDFPSPGPHGGDEETYNNIIRSGEKICRKPEEITGLQCRAKNHPEVSIEHLGQVVQCSRKEGLVCRNQDQQGPFKMCLNYEVRVLCCETPKGCPVTSTPVTAPSTPSGRATSPTQSTSSWQKPRTTTLNICSYKKHKVHSKNQHNLYPYNQHDLCSYTQNICSYKKHNVHSKDQHNLYPYNQHDLCSYTQNICSYKKHNLHSKDHTTSASLSTTTSAPTKSTTCTRRTTTTSAPTTSTTSAPTTSTISAPTTSTTSASTTSTTSGPTTSKTSASTTSTTSSPETTPSPVPATSTTSAPTTSTSSAPTTSTTSIPGTTPSPVPTTSTTSAPTTSTTSAATSSTTSGPGTTPSPVPTTSTTSASTTRTTSAPTSSTTSAPTTRTTSSPGTTPSPVPTTSTTSAPTTSKTSASTTSTTFGPGTTPSPVPTTSTTSAPTTSTSSAPTTSTTSIPGTTASPVPTISTTSAPTIRTTSAPTSSTTSAAITSTTSASTTSTTSGPETTPSPVPTTSTTSASTTRTTSGPGTTPSPVPTTSTTSAPTTSTSSAPTISTSSAPTTSTTSIPGTTPSPVPTISTTSAPTTRTTSAAITSTTSASTTSTTSGPGTTPSPVPTTSITFAPTTSTTSSAPTTSTSSAPTTSTTSSPGTTPSTVPTTNTTSAPTTRTTSTPTSSTTSAAITSTTSRPETTPSPVPTTNTISSYNLCSYNQQNLCSYNQQNLCFYNQHNLWSWNYSQPSSYHQQNLCSYNQHQLCSYNQHQFCSYNQHNLYSWNYSQPCTHHQHNLCSYNQNNFCPYKQHNLCRYTQQNLCFYNQHNLYTTSGPGMTPSPHNFCFYNQNNLCPYKQHNLCSYNQQNLCFYNQHNLWSWNDSQPCSYHQYNLCPYKQHNLCSYNQQNLCFYNQHNLYTTLGPGNTPSPVPTTRTTSAPRTSTSSPPTTSTSSAPTTSTTSISGSTPSPVPTTSTTSAPTTRATSATTSITTSATTTSTISVPTTSTTSAPTTSTSSAPMTSTTSSPGTIPSLVPTTSTTSAPTTSKTSASTTSTTSVAGTTPSPVPTTSTTSAPTTSPSSAPTSSTTSGPGTTPSPVPTTSITSAPTTRTTSAPTSSTTSASTTSTTSGPGTTPSPVPTTSTTSAPTTSTSSVPTTSTTSSPRTFPSPHKLCSYNQHNLCLYNQHNLWSWNDSQPCSHHQHDLCSYYQHNLCYYNQPNLCPYKQYNLHSTDQHNLCSYNQHNFWSWNTTSAPTTSPSSAPTSSTTSGPGTTPSPVPTTSITSAPTTRTTSAPTSSTISASTTSTTSRPGTTSSPVPTTSTTSAPITSTSSVPTTSTISSPGTFPSPVPTTSTTSAPTTSTTSASTTSTTSGPGTTSISAPTTRKTSAPTSSTTSAAVTSTTSGPETTPSPVPTTSTTSAPTTSTTSASTTSTTSGPGTTPSPVPTTSTTSASTTSTTSGPETTPSPLSTTSTTSASTSSTTSGPGTTPSPVPTTSTTSAPTTSTTSGPETTPSPVPTTSTTSASATTTTSGPGTTPSPVPTTSTISAPTTSTTSAPTMSTTLAPTTTTSSASTTSTTSTPTSSTTSAPTTSTTSGPETTPSPVPTTSTSSAPRTSTISGPETTPSPVPTTSTSSAPTTSTTKTSATTTSTTSGPETTLSPVPTTSTSSATASSTTSAPTSSTTSAATTSTTSGPENTLSPIPTTSTTSASTTSTTSGPGTTRSPVPTTSTISSPTTSTTSSPGTTPSPVPTTSTTSVSKTSTSHVSVSKTTHPQPVTSDCHPQCTWTKWFDVDFPSPGPHGRDEETYNNIIRSGEKICHQPEEITRLQCRAKSHPEVSIEHLGQVVQCSHEEGLVCRNQDQQGPFKMCLNYEVRVLCCEIPKGCLVTSVTPYGTSTNALYPSLSTSVASTSVASSSVASSSVASSSVAYSTPTCFCNVTDRLYPAGSTIYHHRDLAGHCYYALCSQDCQVVRGVDSDCPSTTLPPAPATSPWTSTSEPVTELGCPNVVPPRKKGETWAMSNCSEATCEGNNIISLRPRTCPRVEKPTCANGYPALKVADQDGCCHHYQCQCVCSGWGDPHYITFDGTYYTFLDNCTYVLVQQIVPVYGHFRVLVDNDFCGAEDGLSCPKSIILEYQQDRVVLTRKPVHGAMTNEIIFNDKVVSPGFRKNGIVVSRVGIKMYATIPALGVQVMFSGLIFSVEVPFSKFANNTEGQCGTCTNDLEDECRTPEGTVVASCSEMSGLWNVSIPNQPACHGPRPLPTTVGPMTVGSTTFGPTTPSALCPPSSICQLILSKVFEPCHAVIPPLPFYEGCTFDQCHKTDPDTVCSSLELYAALCASQDICIDWRGRTNHTCPFTCPADKVYQPCGPSNASYCYGNDSASLGALPEAGPITEGCFCPEGMTLFSTSAQVCVPTGCPRCLGPHGEPVEVGHTVGRDCQECTCEAATWTLTCRPKLCPLPPACPLPGFVPVPAAPQAGQCCPQYNCVCNTSRCPAPVDCPEGARAIPTYEEGTCCPVQNCNWTECSINGTLYQPGAVVSSSLCETCRCELPGGSLSDTFVVSCETQICNTHCPVGFEYQEQSGQCCGTCVQVACVTNTSGSSIHLFYPGETWSDPGNHCVTHECEKHLDGLVVVTTKKACPPLSCSLDEARKSEDGCCHFCPPPPLPPQYQNQSTCAVYHRSQIIQQQGCNSSEPVRLAYCRGNCGDSSSMYSFEGNMVEHRCQCCQELRTSLRNVTLHCTDGSSRAFSFTEVEQCGCMGRRCPAPGDTQHSEEMGPKQSQEAGNGSWERGTPVSPVH
ncbi:mucin-5AC [Trachypithecus francoisi]|uniref:mucin-5AC n=1 Tax=Trachypithecus francoisi TaxID=54180 RepID=UPI00141A9DB8|nr:mucin-5AC [Trachypithecus francoisi]